jgi:hypothetical protein
MSSGGAHDVVEPLTSTRRPDSIAARRMRQIRRPDITRRIDPYELRHVQAKPVFEIMRKAPRMRWKYP